MVFPIGDDNARIPIAPTMTVLLISVNVAVFILELLQGRNIEHFLGQYALIPLEYTQQQDLPPLIPLPYWATSLTALFLHGGWLHLLTNMIFLRIFGDNVEGTMGHGRFLGFYLLCGLAGALCHWLFYPLSVTPALGASGAIAGVLGSYVLQFPTNRVRLLVFLWGIIELPAWVVLGFWMFLQVLSSVLTLGPTVLEQVGGVAYWTHVGGFLTGMLLTPLFRKPRLRESINWSPSPRRP